jgi:hypothetical protein
MAWRKIAGPVAFVFASISLSGCGTVVPNIKEAWDTDAPEHTNSKGEIVQSVPGAGQIEFEIKRSVFCELAAAVHEVNKNSQHRTGESPKPVIPNDWNALVSLSLEVDESSQLNPGIAANIPMANAISTFGVVNKTPVTTSTPQAFSLGFGATLSSTATRIDKFDPTWTIGYLYNRQDIIDPEKDGCNPEHDVIKIDANGNPARSSPLITRDPGLNISSDLGLKDWLLGATVVNNYFYSVTGPLVSKETLAHERDVLSAHNFSKVDIKNIVDSGANLEDISSLTLTSPQEYSRANLLRYLGKCVSPLQLQQLKGEGYKDNEIEQILTPQTCKGTQQSSGGSGGQTPDTISIEIKFVIVSNGNVTPTWKLLRVSANTGSAPLFGLGRTRTHDLIITIGPPNAATASTHLASQIGNAVSNGNRAQPSAQSSNTFNPF